MGNSIHEAQMFFLGRLSGYNLYSHVDNWDQLQHDQDP